MKNFSDTIYNCEHPPTLLVLSLFLSLSLSLYIYIYIYIFPMVSLKFFIDIVLPAALRINSLEIWKPQPPGILRASPGL